ncbi:MAG: hypothetical protein ACHQE6_09940 [Solirubrobacterales bacterium]
MMEREVRDAIAELSFWSNDLVDAWELYLRCGGFPRAVRDLIETGDVTPGFIQDLWDVVRGEAIRATSLGDADLLNLLARIAQNLCSPLNASGVAKDVGLGSHHAVNDRVNDLVFAFQTWKCHQIDARGRPNTNSRGPPRPRDHRHPQHPRYRRSHMGRAREHRGLAARELRAKAVPSSVGSSWRERSFSV